MKTLTHFWRALESVSDQAAVEAVWRRACSQDWSWAKRLVRPTAELALCYPKLDANSDSPADYDVVCHDDDADDYVGVCPDGTGRITLSRKHLVICELDVQGLATQITRAFQLVGDFSEMADISHVCRVGAYNPLGTDEVWIYLAIPPEPDDLFGLLSKLTLHHSAPFLVLTPTKRTWRRWPHTLRQNGCDVVALEEALFLGDGGELVATPSALAVLTKLKRREETEVERPDGYYPPGTIVWRGVEHDCELTKQEATFFQLTYAREDTEVHQLMHRGKGAVWRRRYLRTKQNRDATAQLISRLNKKLLNATPPVRLRFSLRRHHDLVNREDLDGISPSQGTAASLTAR